MQPCQLQRKDEVLVILVAHVRVHPIPNRGLGARVVTISLLLYHNSYLPLDFALGVDLLTI